MGFQSTFLDFLVGKFFTNKPKAVKAIANVLSLGQDSIYRRLNEETALTADQLFLLAREFGISLDQFIFADSNSIVFRFTGYPNRIKSFKEYALSLLNEIKSNGDLPNFRVYYGSSEIPVFLYMFYPKLLCFKFYVYGMTVWDMPFIKTTKFSFDLLSPEVEELAKITAKGYTGFLSIDVWTIGIVDNTLNQLEYLAEIKKFERLEDALTICDDLFQLVNHCRNMAEKGTKFVPGTRVVPDTGNFDLYYNEFSTTNNTILGIHDHGSILFSTLQHPNFLTTKDQRLCNMLENWFLEIIQNASPLSKAARKERDWYFNRLEEKIEVTRDKIKAKLKNSTHSIIY